MVWTLSLSITEACCLFCYSVSPEPAQSFSFAHGFQHGALRSRFHSQSTKFPLGGELTLHRSAPPLPHNILLKNCSLSLYWRTVFHHLSTYKCAVFLSSWPSLGSGVFRVFTLYLASSSSRIFSNFMHLPPQYKAPWSHDLSYKYWIDKQLNQTFQDQDSRNNISPQGAYSLIWEDDQVGVIIDLLVCLHGTGGCRHFSLSLSVGVGEDSSMVNVSLCFRISLNL